MSRFFLIWVTAFSGLLFSCRSTKNIQVAVTPRDTIIVIPEETSLKREDSMQIILENYKMIVSNRLNYTTFSAKIDVDYIDAEGKKFDVNAHVRMYKDSVIWISITGALGFEGLRAYITADSVKLLDKQNKTYVYRSVSYLQEVTELPLDLASLQDLLVGNPVFMDSNIVSYSRTANTISLISSGIFFKNLFTMGEPDKQMLSCKLDDMNDQRNRTCYLTYTDYEKKKGVNFSTQRNISVAEKKKLDIKLRFKQYNFNETLSFPFSIPKSYNQN